MQGSQDIGALFSHARSLVTRDWIESNFRASGAEWRGKDYFTICPFRDDRHVGSFSISETGWYSDFADPSIKGDVFQLLAKTIGGTAVEHAKQLAGSSFYSAPAPEKRQEFTIPQWAPLPDYPPAGRADLITRYTDPASGHGVFYVLRTNTEIGKQIRPWYFDGQTYRPGIPPGYAIRPLLPLKYSVGTVLLVEGEKCQDAAQRYFDAMQVPCSVTTWHGGVAAVGKVDISPLAGRTVVLWPDNDAVGLEAMRTLQAAATKVGCKTGWVEVKSEIKGWDVADAIDSDVDILTLVKNARDAAVLDVKKAEETEAEFDLYKPNQDALADKFMLTDLGNAERLVALFGDRIRYNYDKGCWMVCEKFVWRGDDPSAITPMVKKTLEAISQTDDKYGFKCESSKAISAMLSLASREVGVPVREQAFDKDPYCFNAANTLLDVRTGLPIEGTPEMLISKKGAVEYDPEAKCPRFLQFLDEITISRPEISTFLQRWFGASLSGDTSMQSFAIFFGHGANGKSTLTELIARIIGDYAKNAPPETFTAKTNGGGIPNDVAALRGARMVMATETEANARLAESKIKSLTGGDMVSARYMRGEFFEFLPSWKIIISTNHKPRISGADHGIWRRIILVPFDFIATTESMDPMLSQKLWAERSGVLNWMLEGAKAYFAEGGGRAALKVPEIMLEETTEYRTEEDVIGRFILEECYTKEEIIRLHLPPKVSVNLVQNTFRAWCEANNENYAAKMSSVAFGKAMADRGIEKCRMGDGGRGYLNIFPRDHSGENNYQGGSN